MNRSPDGAVGGTVLPPLKRSRWYALALGSAFLGIGIAGIYITFPFELRLTTTHNIVHLIAGALGVVTFRRATVYAKWVGIISTTVSIAGLAGLSSLFGLIDLTTYFTYLYGLIGIVSLLAYLDDKSRR